MRIAKHTFEYFQKVAKEKRIIAFAASDFLRLICLNYKELALEQCIDFVVDNDKKKHGTSIILSNIEKKIFLPQKIINDQSTDFAILISSDTYADVIYKQIQDLFSESDIEVFFLSLMIAKKRDDVVELDWNSGKESINQIPKVIHYFWFSKEEKKGLVLQCLDSWKQCCPDYELKEWNADNYDIMSNQFAYEAFRCKKWAYASDYARLDVVYRFGGIYMDLDVLLRKKMDPLLFNDFFIGFGPIRDMEAAVFGAVPGCPIVKEMMELYQNRSFDPDQSTTLMNLQPILLDRFFEKKGFAINGKYQRRNGITIYPRNIFSAKNWFTGEDETTASAVGIHECAGGWVSATGKSIKQIKKECNKNLERIYTKECIQFQGEL